MDKTIIEQMKTRPESVEEMCLDIPGDKNSDFKNLINLKTLHLRCFNVNDSVKIPDELFNLPIEELEASNTRARYIIQFPKLKRLRWSVDKLSKEQLAEDLALIYQHKNHLESLCIENARDLALTTGIKQMRQLQNFCLYCVQMTEFPTQICRLKQLKRISLENSKIDHLNALTKMGSLKELVIHSCEIGGAGLTELKGIKSLKQFRLFDKQTLEDKPTKPNLDFLKSNRRLSNVDITVGIVDIDSFKGLSDLKNLDITCQEFSGGELSTLLKQLKNLEDLKIKSYESVLDIEYNKKWPGNLNCLELSFQKISGLGTIATAKGLKKLTIASEFLFNVEDFQGLMQLEELSLQGTNRTSRPVFEIRILASLCDLKILKLQNFDIKDSEEITNLPRLEKLHYDMKYCKNVQPLDLRLLQRFENLTTFELQGTIVTDSHNSGIMPGLKELILNETELTNKDIESQHRTMFKFNKINKLTFVTHEFDAEILKNFMLLNELDIEGVKVKSIDVLLGLPALKTLKARPEVMAKWKSKNILCKVLLKEDISVLLESESLEFVVQGIHQMAQYTQINSTDENNTVTDLFPNDFERVGSYSIYRSKTMRKIMQKYGNSFERETLIEICQAFLHSYTDSYEHILEVLQIFIDRKDSEGQLWFIELFKQAYENYDTGNRTDDGSMYDLLIDKYLKAFEPRPLLEFLLWCDTDYYGMQYGDRIDVLFRPAFEKISNPEQLKKLLNRYKIYLQEQIESGNAEYIIEEKLLEGYDEHPSVQLREIVRRFRENLKDEG